MWGYYKDLLALNQLLFLGHCGATIFWMKKVCVEWHTTCITRRGKAIKHARKRRSYWTLLKFDLIMCVSQALAIIRGDEISKDVTHDQNQCCYTFPEEVMIRLLWYTASTVQFSSDACPTWNVKGWAFRQAAQGLSSLVHRSSREYRQRWKPPANKLLVVLNALQQQIYASL